ncbi:gliding motility-associated C-terminal domain-containing protein [Ekhidna sp.]|uniref:T9SS type B sorting domain-containing protein n=1 Tax=Ekhidna sp. TaxID=2608089 RepID=UPI003B5C2FCE
MATFSQPGSYWVERETNSGVTRENFTITEFDYELNLFSSEELVLCQTDFPYELTTQLEGDFLWNTGENGNAIQIVQEGYYWVESITDCGVIRDSLYIETVKLNDVFIPNVITPNNDGKNDCFIVDNQLIGSELVIINRAGVRVFFSENYANNWCPNLPIGAYYYQIKDYCTANSYVGWLSILN